MNILQKFLRVLSLAKISITVIIVMSIILLRVPQAEDAIIALGNSRDILKIIFFIIISIIWALMNWYLPRTLFYMEYHKESGLTELERITIAFIPRITGTCSLLLIAISSIIKGFQIPQSQHGKSTLVTVGIVFIILAVIFMIFTIYRRRLCNLNSIGNQTSSLIEVNGMIPFKNLHKPTKRIILFSILLSSLLLLIITVIPIHSTRFLGDGATVLIIASTIWLPYLYIVRYIGLRYRVPTFLLLGIIILTFSFFNGNSSVRTLNHPQSSRLNFSDLYRQREIDGPLVMILSEGGGIRAAYWSSSLMTKLSSKLPNLREQILSISGVSGGSFGVVLYEGVQQSSILDKLDNIREISGQDYLSPIIGTMFTRGIIQTLLPIGIESFDHAKIFEKSWEMSSDLFSKPIDTLWQSPHTNPALILNITRVEDGLPVVISSSSIKGGLTSDLQEILGQEKTFRVSTSALLSARFPYVGPAGIIDQNGYVDGGYFDNTGAYTTYEALMDLYRDSPLFYLKNRPIIIYIKNGVTTENSKKGINSLFYQWFAPIKTMMQIRDASTLTSLNRLEELVKFMNGDFITFSLNQESLHNEVPLGWSLSETTRDEIDGLVDSISESEEYKRLESLLQ